VTMPRDACRVAVIGSIVMDHKWIPVGCFTGRDGQRQSLWRIDRRHGGVGRNVAENLARLGVPVSFVALSGSDGPAEEMAARLRAAGVGLRIVWAPGGVGRFDVLLDEAGRLTHSSIHLPDVDLLSWAALTAALPGLGGAAVVVVETGLSEPMLRTLREHTRARGIRLLGMPTRLAALGSRWPLVREMDILVLNEIEAAAMTGLPGGDLPALRAQVGRLRAGGPDTVVLTCGDRGVVAAGPAEPRPRHFPVAPVLCVDDTGAGDALTAALLAALVEQADLATAVALGIEAARVTVGCPGSTCPRIAAVAGHRR
jgi:ribokinase